MFYKISQPKFFSEVILKEAVPFEVRWYVCVVCVLHPRYGIFRNSHTPLEIIFCIAIYPAGFQKSQGKIRIWLEV